MPKDYVGEQNSGDRWRSIWRQKTVSMIYVEENWLWEILQAITKQMNLAGKINTKSN